MRDQESVRCGRRPSTTVQSAHQYLGLQSLLCNTGCVGVSISLSAGCVGVSISLRAGRVGISISLSAGRVGVSVSLSAAAWAPAHLAGQLGLGSR